MYEITSFPLCISHFDVQKVPDTSGVWDLIQSANGATLLIGDMRAWVFERRL